MGAFLLGGLIFGGGATASNNIDSAAGKVAAPTATVTATATATPPAPTATVTATPPAPTATKTVKVTPKPRIAVEGDGMFLVGVDLKPGTYRNHDGGDCYWERLSGTTGDFNDLIANGGTSGQNVLTIKPSDVAVSFSRCGSWEKIG